MKGVDRVRYLDALDLRSAGSWPAVLAAIAVVVMIVLARGEVDFSYQDPDFRFIAIAIGSLLVLGRRLPLLVWAWWGWGALTHVWSLAPGNTHVTAIWEVTYLAAFAAASWRPAFWIVSVAVLSDGAFSVLALASVGLSDYTSGSINYVVGALALAVVPVLVAKGMGAKDWIWTALWGVAGSTVVYLALASGSRAVYLPLALVVLAIFARVANDRSYRLSRAALLAASTVLGVVALEVVLPGGPLASAFGLKLTVGAQVGAAGEYGAFSQRLRFWDQTLEIARAHPLGSGLGSYQAVIHAFQKYPMLWSNSPHNYFIETIATGGWPRLALLVVLLAISTISTWKSGSWAWVLGALALWVTFAFDVTSYYPSVMMFAFLALGASYYRVRPAAEKADTVCISTPALKRGVAVIGLVAATGLAAWWFVPCTGTGCYLTRFHGVPNLATQNLAEVESGQRNDVLNRLRELYPKSLWVLRLEQRYAERAEDHLAIAAEIARRFPLQSPQNYLDWATAAMAVGDSKQAVEAVREGLAVFGPDDYPYGEQRMTPELYRSWLDQADAILVLAGERPPSPP